MFSLAIVRADQDIECNLRGLYFDGGGLSTRLIGITSIVFRWRISPIVKSFCQKGWDHLERIRYLHCKDHHLNRTYFEQNASA